jgi:hypothetical protein
MIFGPEAGNISHPGKMAHYQTATTVEVVN